MKERKDEERQEKGTESIEGRTGGLALLPACLCLVGFGAAGCCWALVRCAGHLLLLLGCCLFSDS
jgi:hypothetical protein